MPHRGSPGWIPTFQVIVPTDLRFAAEVDVRINIGHLVNVAHQAGNRGDRRAEVHPSMSCPCPFNASDLRGGGGGDAVHDVLQYLRG